MDAFLDLYEQVFVAFQIFNYASQLVILCCCPLNARSSISEIWWIHKEVVIHWSSNVKREGELCLHFHPSSIFYEDSCKSIKKMKSRP